MVVAVRARTMKIIYQGEFKGIDLTFACGDLFEAKVDAIVSSEQSDFVLDRGGHSISGQIWHRYGDGVQAELDAQTKGQVLRAGTVISTGGGKDFKTIFHAGFHDPDDWLNVPGGSAAAEHLAAIGACIHQVLDAAIERGVRSVAFPLIGCGLFGLDEKMLILQFLDAIERAGSRQSGGAPPGVWLVIRENEQLLAIVGVLIDLLLGQRGDTLSMPVERTGVPILDEFAENLRRRSTEEWVKWQLCRFAEIAVQIMCFGLCRAAKPPSRPESLFEEGTPATFGVVREHALNLSVAMTEIPCGSWGVRFFRDVMMDKSATRALETINFERNNLAHGRKTSSVAEIEGLVRNGLRLGDWKTIRDSDGDLVLADWAPWVRVASGAQRSAGLFERWQKNAIRYLIPGTGEVFKVPRQSSDGIPTA